MALSKDPKERIQGRRTNSPIQLQAQAISREIEVKMEWFNTVVTSTPFGAVTLKTESRSEFKVNGQRLKHYLRGSIKEVDPDFEKGKENY